MTRELLWVSLCVAATALASKPAAAQEDDTWQVTLPPWPVLDGPSSAAIGFEGYCGLVMHATSRDDWSYLVGGGVVRLRLHYFQAGGRFEFTDDGSTGSLYQQPRERWRAFGGFAGVWLPFRRWINLEAAVGLMSRSYTDERPRYGPNGFERSLPSLVLRFGAADRSSSESDVGARLGAALVASIDLGRAQVPWARRYVLASGPVETAGTTSIGGVSVGLAVTGGIEVGGTTQR